MKELRLSSLPQPGWPLLDCTINAILRFSRSMDDVRAIARFALSIDVQAYEAIRQKYAEKIDKTVNPSAEQKYFDSVYWAAHKLLLVRELGLDRGPPRRVLDLGTGAGHFVAMAQAFGHECVATDIQNEWFDDLAGLIGVRRKYVPVLRCKALPSFGKKFDVVTSIWITFNAIYPPGQGSEMAMHHWANACAHWSIGDWAFLLDDLARNHLNLPGRIYLVLNKNDYPDGTSAFDEAIFDWFESIGAKLERTSGIVDIQVTRAKMFAGLVPEDRSQPAGTAAL